MLGNLGEGLDNLLLGMGDCLVTICRLLYSSCIQRQDYTRIYYRCINYSALIACFWIATFGGTAMWFDLHQDAQIAQSVHNDVTVALFQLFEHLPLSMIASTIGILLIIIF